MASKYVSGDMDLHPTKTLSPIAITNVAPTAMFVNPDDERFVEDGMASWDKVVAYAKANPGQMTVSNINVAMELATMGKVEEYFGISTKQVMFDKPGAALRRRDRRQARHPDGAAGRRSEARSGRQAAARHRHLARAVRYLRRHQGDRGGLRHGLESAAAPPQLLGEERNAPGNQGLPGRGIPRSLPERGPSGVPEAAKALDIVNSYYGAADMAGIFDEAIGTYTKVFKETGQRVRADLQ